MREKKVKTQTGTGWRQTGKLRPWKLWGKVTLVPIRNSYTTIIANNSLSLAQL